MKAIATIAALVIVLLSSTAHAQTSATSPIGITKNVTTGQVRVFCNIPSVKTGAFYGTKDHVTGRIYLLDNEVYIFVQDEPTDNKLTVWYQKTNATEAHYLGTLPRDIQSDMSLLLPDAFQMKNQYTSTYPLLVIKPKPEVLAKM